MKINNKYLDPFTDFGFKRLFGSKASKEHLIVFLNQLIDPVHQITNLSYKNTEQLGQTDESRKAIFDLFCENEKGEQFIIELQNVRQDFFKDRSIYYATFPIQEQAAKGEWDFELKAVYTICILNFNFPDADEVERYIRTIKLTDQQTHDVFFDKLSFIYLEINRFKKSEDELATMIDKWMYVLKHLATLQERPKALQERMFDKFFEQAELAKLNKKEMDAYQESLKVKRDNYNVIETARKEGSFQKAFDVAKLMLKYGDPIDKICSVTGLTRKQVESLK